MNQATEHTRVESTARSSSPGARQGHWFRHQSGARRMEPTRPCALCTRRVRRDGTRLVKRPVRESGTRRGSRGEPVSSLPRKRVLWLLPRSDESESILASSGGTSRGRRGRTRNSHCTLALGPSYGHGAPSCSFRRPNPIPCGHTDARNSPCNALY